MKILHNGRRPELLKKEVTVYTKDLSSRKLTNILFLLIVIMMYSCTKPDTTFYDTVLGNINKGSYFVAFNIRSPSYKGRIVIQNENLYNFLHNTKGLDTLKYKTYMEKILVHKRTIKIKENDLSKWNFHKVEDVPSVILNANTGSDNFIDHYFDGIVLKYGITEEEMYAVINQLFYWQIPCKIGSETGELLIGN